MAQSPKSPGLDNKEPTTKKFHEIDEFLDLTWEQLFEEPVYVSHLEEDTEQVGQGQESDVSSDERFLELAFEELFNIPVRVFRIQETNTQDSAGETNVQTVPRGGSSFGEYRVVELDQTFDDGIVFVSSLGNINFNNFVEVTTISFELLPPIFPPQPSNPVPTAPLFYAGALQENLNDGSYETQTITGNLFRNANSQFVNSPEAYAFNNLNNNLFPSGGNDGLSLEIFIRPESGQLKSEVEGSSKVTITTDAGNTLEFYTANEGSFKAGDFIYTLFNPIFHGENTNNIPQTDTDSLTLDSNGDFIPTVPELNWNLFQSLTDSTYPSSGVLLIGPNNSDEYQIIKGLDQNGNLITLPAVLDEFNSDQNIYIINPVNFPIEDISDLLFLNGQGDGDIDNTYYEVFVYDAVDGDGDRARNFIVFKIVDDQPVAVDDVNAINETAAFADNAFTVTGNVFDNDELSADGTQVLSVLGVTDNGVGDLNPNEGVIEVETDFGLGSIQVNTSTGEYTYTLLDTSVVVDENEDGFIDDVIAVTIIDGDGDTNSSELTVTIDLNQAPTAVADSYNIGAEATLNIAAAGLLANDTDPDNVPPDEQHIIEVDGDANLVGDSFALERTITLTDPNGLNVNIDVAPLLTVNQDGSFSFEPNGEFAELAQDESKSITFDYTMTDAKGFNTGELGLQSDTTVTLTITGVNDAPTINATDSGSLIEDGIVLVASGDLNATDIDVSDNNELTVTFNGGIPQSIFDTTGGNINIDGDWGTLSIDAQGNWSYALDNDAAQALAGGEGVTDIFEVDYSDAFQTASSTITLNITGVNDAPVAIDDSFDINEDVVLDSGNVFDANGGAADSDVDNGDVLTVTEVEGVAGNVGNQFALASGALLTINSDGTFSYDQNGAFDSLASGESDTDSFTYTVSDGDLTDTATVTITINGVNDAPVAIDDSFDVNEDVVLNSGNVLDANGGAADSDVDNGDVLTVTDVEGVVANVGNQFALASGALLTLNSDGTFSYDQNGAFDSLASGESDTDSFTYTVSDGDLTDTATVTITINGVNDAPVAADDTFAVDEDVVLNAVNVLDANGGAPDSDVDNGDTLTVTEVEGVAGNVNNLFALASGALLTLNSDGTFSYDQNGVYDSLAFGDTDTDSFTYTVSDGDLTDTATVSITINGVNDAPVAADDTFAVDEDVVLNAVNVLDANGGSADSDVDNGNILTVAEVEGVAGNVGNQFALASGALLTLNSDGTFSYDQNGAFDSLASGESDIDSFTYTVSDGDLTDTATVSITINGVNDPVPPIVFDLDGNDQIDLISAHDSNIVLEQEGRDYQVGWAAPSDGFLMFDRDGDGQFSSLNEISFVDDHPDAQTDLEGLRLAFDSNQDNVFDAQDEQFSEFGIWQDKNSNGQVDDGEFNSLIDHGILSINLVSDNQSQSVEGNVIYGISHYTMENGEVGIIGDVGLEAVPLEQSDVFKDVEQDLNLNDLLSASNTESSEIGQQVQEPVMEDSVSFDASQQSLESMMHSANPEQPDL